MAIDKNRSFFVEGSGSAIIHGKNGKVALMHLQDMTLEVSSDSDKIEGGGSLFPLYTFVTSKDIKVTFTNASVSMAALAMLQGVEAKTRGTVFKTETVTVGSAGELPLTVTTDIEADSVAAFKDGNAIAVTETAGTFTVPISYAGDEVEVFYRYVEDGVVGMDVLTTSIPDYVEINHVSKPIKQKDGTSYQMFTTVYKARSNGSLKLDMKNKTAFAPEYTFEAVDPERADDRFLSITTKDVTV